MDYYKRMKLMQTLVKQMIKAGSTDEEIYFAVYDTYQIGKSTTQKYLDMLRGVQ